MDKADYDSGMRALKYYYDELDADFDFQSFLLTVRKIGVTESFISGLGLGIKFAEADEGEVQEAMADLAEKMNYKIPAKPSVFTLAVSDRLQEVDFDMIKNVAIDTALESGKIAVVASQNIGSILTTILKSKKILISIGVLFTLGIAYKVLKK